MPKKMILALLVGSLVLNMTPVYANEQELIAEEILLQEEISVDETDETLEEEYKEVENNQSQEVSMPLVEWVEYESPKVIEDRTFIPLRFWVEEVLGGQLGYDPSTKVFEIIHEDQNILLTVGSNKIYFNGEEKIVSTAPIIEEDTTWIPIKSMADLFGTQIYYINEADVLKIEKPVIIINQPPVVSFSFVEEDYTEGELLEVEIEMNDPEGDTIVDQRWMLNGNTTQFYPTIEALSKAADPGYLEVAFQAKDEKGNWSEWYTQYIVLSYNRAPLITELTTSEEEYAQGEPITFEYLYENEEFEGIKAERWTYRRKNERVNQSIVQKPEAIYAEGEYIVTLELQDDVGQWSEKAEVIVEITDEQLKTEFEVIFNGDNRGAIITNFGYTNFREYEDVEFEYTDEPGTLIMSDSPEIVKEEGILYEDYIEGEGRVLFHHINDFEDLEKKKLVVVLENEGEKVVNGWIKNQGVKGPATDILFAGQQLLYDYLKDDTMSYITILPGQTHIVYDSSDRNWLKDHVITGQFNFDLHGEVKIKVVAMDADKTLEDIAYLGYPERDVHPRGTFDVINREIRVDLTDEKEPTKIVVGQGGDEWLVGTDGITGEEALNKGNFGVEHEIVVTAKEDTAVILNPRGNMYKGAVKWGADDIFMTPEIGYFPDEKRATFLGVIKAGETRRFTYVLPNGSSAPVVIGFIPEDYWD